jgi:hypothetical protein
VVSSGARLLTDPRKDLASRSGADAVPGRREPDGIDDMVALQTGVSSTSLAIFEFLASIAPAKEGPALRGGVPVRVENRGSAGRRSAPRKKRDRKSLNFEGTLRCSA